MAAKASTRAGTMQLVTMRRDEDAKHEVEAVQRALKARSTTVTSAAMMRMNRDADLVGMKLHPAPHAGLAKRHHQHGCESETDGVLVLVLIAGWGLGQQLHQGQGSASDSVPGDVAW